MNKEEKEARKICAWCSFVNECWECPHRVWPEGKWLKKPRFDWKKCQEWKHYTSEIKPNPLLVFKDVCLKLGNRIKKIVWFWVSYE